jgi:ubiquinone/menaquinone biosynthesis C-methylase UbiE
MDLSTTLRRPLLTYMHLRSAVYAVEGLLSPLIEVVVNRRRPRLPTDDKALFKASREALNDLLRKDAENILNGIYPITVLKPEPVLEHLKRIPKMFKEGIAIAKRRNEKQAKVFAPEFSEVLENLPEYYRRNFHFQGDGYLSRESAELYDHQVNVLFAGAADAMRRLVLPPLVDRFGSTSGEGLRFLEIAAGAGTTTQFVRATFPKAEIIALDLSEAYLALARERLRKFGRIHFIQGKAEELRFEDNSFDAVYSAFLFHELPEEIRTKVIEEAFRVLKPNGRFIAVDSLQKGDRPELDIALENFPQEFHEPFYKNYINKPLETFLRKAGLRGVKSDSGFFSKVVAGDKTPLVRGKKKSKS